MEGEGEVNGGLLVVVIDTNPVHWVNVHPGRPSDFGLKHAVSSLCQLYQLEKLQMNDYAD